MDQASPEKPEAVLSEDALWAQAQKDRASTPADETPETPQHGEQPGQDPLADLPEPTRKLIAEIQVKQAEQEANLKAAGQKLATAHGTIGNLTQRLNASLGALKKIEPTVQAVEAQQQAEAERAKAEREQKRKELRERLSDMPDLVEYLDAVLPADDKPAEKKEPKQETKQEIAPEKPAAQDTIEGKDELTVAKLQLALSEKSPGWQAKRDSAEYPVWLAKQDAEIKRKAGSWDVDEAASVFAAFDKYREDAAKVAGLEAQRQERLRRGETVQGRGSAQPGEALSADALWQKVQRDRAKLKAG